MVEKLDGEHKEKAIDGYNKIQKQVEKIVYDMAETYIQNEITSNGLDKAIYLDWTDFKEEFEKENNHIRKEFSLALNQIKNLIYDRILYPKPKEQLKFPFMRKYKRVLESYDEEILGLINEYNYHGKTYKWGDVKIWENPSNEEMQKVFDTIGDDEHLIGYISRQGYIFITDVGSRHIKGNDKLLNFLMSRLHVGGEDLAPIPIGAYKNGDIIVVWYTPFHQKDDIKKWIRKANTQNNMWKIKGEII